MTPLAVLQAARALIADPAHWCQGTSAVDEHGSPVSWFNPAGCKWCASGAIARVAVGTFAEPSDFFNKNRDALDRALELLGSLVGPFADIRPSSFVPVFNDSHTHAEVLALFDCAIAAELAKEAA